MSYELSDLFSKTVEEAFGADSGAAQYREHLNMDGDPYGGGFMSSSTVRELSIHMVFFKGADHQLDRAYAASAIIQDLNPFKCGKVVSTIWQSNDREDISIDCILLVNDLEGLLKEMKEYARIRWEKEFTTKMDDLCTT